MKILELTTKHWLTGIASGSHIEKGGLWHKAEGINPFINPVQGNSDVGLLQTSPVATEVTGGVGGTPIASVTRLYGTSVMETYIATTLGVSKIDIIGTGDNNATTVFSATDLQNGLALFTAKGTTAEYLYYFHNLLQIGRYGPLNGTPTVNGSWGNITASIYHPVHKMWDSVYFGNDRYIGKIYDSGGGGTANTNVLDFEQGMLITALSDDGQFLVIGMSSNTGDNSVYGRTLVRFWKIDDPSWSYEWSIPESNIIGIKKVGSKLYATCPNGIYIFNRSTPPVKVRSLSSSASFGQNGAIGTYSDALLIGGGKNGTVASYGKILPELPTSYHEPLTGGGTGATTLIIDDAKVDRIYVGTDQSKLYRYNLTVGGTTGVAPETVFMPLGSQFDINRIEVILAEPMVIGDSLSIKLQADNDVAATTWGTISFTKHGVKKRIALEGKKNDIDNLKIIPSFDAGNVKIKTINVFGDKKDKNE